MNRFALPEYPWSEVEKTKTFIRALFKGPAPDRPGCVVHHRPAPGAAAPARGEPPAELTELQRNAWHAVQAIRQRPPGRDDYVPILGTGAGTCAMATAFGCPETTATGVCWVEPCIRTSADMDRVRKPAVTAGKLGGVLAQTRSYADAVDERVAIGIMDFQSPFTTVEQMLGSDLFFTLPYDDPRRFKALMDVVTDYAIEFFQAQLAMAGPNACRGSWPGIWFPPEAGIQMSDDNMVNVSPAIYEEFVVPYNNRIAAAFGGLFLHSCTIKEANLPPLAKIRGLTGVNCDISTSVSPRRLCEFFENRILVAPHAYINTDTDFKSYAEFMAYVLDGWQPGRRLFIYPCTVLYMKATSTELAFNAAEVRAALNAFPGWRRDRG